mmetsp:Transcript_95501/g.189283  ORF Transcript_95501/g.189283 Transcript_95501/m.189283 type:complete len:89 (+) Transcript_95501:116-382(+)
MLKHTKAAADPVVVPTGPTAYPDHFGQFLTSVFSKVEYIVYATATYMLRMKRSRGTTELTRVRPSIVTKYWSFKNCIILAGFSLMLMV